jgi:hypothetical protein
MPRCPSRIQGKKAAARLAAGRQAGGTFKPLPSSDFEYWRRESAMAYRETDERGKFFSLLTVTKHFLFFFSTN